ncbi:cystinosin homolog isoform X2 [Abrus precatorius]|uniref:Cystinosin homolog isoform X2 n=1 Tax=Abrus precatorius TaxID=3816 RepID=A0A8B8L8U9_ABRPR|nr:cystinosin homolog isoform X2 [Abrus precatorius]
MASWNSVPLNVTYEFLGWFAFVSWSVSFYPQVILNFRRKSSAIQKQYFDKYGYEEMIPVAANDVAFSIHAVLLTAITLFQIAIYERGSQKVSKISVGIVSVAWLTAAVCFFVALSNHSWLWLLSIFNSIQVVMTIVKYIPQAIMNFVRKSTDGFSIGNILLDFSGGIANYGQMVVQSIDQNSWINFYGNIGKVLLSLVSVFFDIIFIIQHYVLYRGQKSSKAVNTTEHEDQIREHLVRPSDQLPQENV